MHPIKARTLHSVAVVSLISLIALLIGCAPTLRPVGTDSTIAGTRIRGTSITLSEPFSYKWFSSTHTLPEGKYVPTLEDDYGVYFQAPSKLLSSDGLSQRLFDGGLHIGFEAPHVASSYFINDDGLPVTHVLPSKFIYSIEEGVNFNKEHYDQTIKDYTRSIEISPRDAEAYNKRGFAYLNKGQYEKAISDLNKAMELNPQYAEAYRNRGVVYLKKAHYEKAVSDFNKAIELNPRDVRAYNLRGVLMLKLGDTRRACSDAKRACELGDCAVFETLKIGGACK